MSSTKEIWKDIPGYEGLYQASNLGGVRRIKIVYLKPALKQDGRLNITLTKDGKAKTRVVSRLVASAFMGLDIQNSSQVVLHIDDNPSNNLIENLRLGTIQDNIEDMVSKGRQARGDKSGKSKIRETDAKDIKKMLREGKSVTYITRMFNISRDIVYNIQKNITWKHVL